MKVAVAILQRLVTYKFNFAKFNHIPKSLPSFHQYFRRKNTSKDDVSPFFPTKALFRLYEIEFMKQFPPKRLRRRNNILKKKLEKMGSVHSVNPMPPEIENQFLENVLAFENAYQKNKKQLTVFNKLGKPDGFKPVVEIPENRIEQEWNELYTYLLERGIDLQVCSPNVGPRELYRFATEELFRKKIQSFSIPGMMTCFIYDEFHPDHVYDNQVTAVTCIENFFSCSS